jgi:WD40 repeat protein
MISAWSLVERQLLFSTRLHLNSVNFISLSPLEKHIYSYSSDGIMFVWDITRAKAIAQFNLDKDVICMEMSRNVKRQMFVVGRESANIEVWDLRRKECVMALKGHRGPVTCILWFEDFKLVSGSSDGAVKIWDLTKMNKYHTINAKDMVMDLQTHKNNLISLHNNGLLKVTSLDTFEVLSSYYISECCKILICSEYLLCITPTAILILNPTTGITLSSIKISIPFKASYFYNSSQNCICYSQITPNRVYIYSHILTPQCKPETYTLANEVLVIST